MGTKGKGQGVDLKTPEKPVPSSRVRVTLGIYRHQGCGLPLVFTVGYSVKPCQADSS